MTPPVLVAIFPLMSDGKNEDQESRVRIRPRNVSREDAEKTTRGKNTGAPDVEVEESGELPRWEKVKKNLLKQSGVKFPAKLDARSDPEGLWSDGPAPSESKEATFVSAKEPEPNRTDELPAGERRVRKKEGRSRRLIPKESFRKFKKWFWRTWHLETKVGYFSIALLLCSFLVWKTAHHFGVARGVRIERAAHTKEGLEVPEEFNKSVDTALLALRNGDAKSALADLLKLEKQQPHVASMSYLVALAAMRSGEISLAEANAAESIDKEERISDALALQAVLEGMKRATPGYRVMGNAKMRAELLLNQAILADAANPIPYIRLAMLLRYQKRNSEAAEMLRAGWARLNPVDSHVMVEATTSLIKLEETPDSQLPELSPDFGKNPAALFAAAYTALRRNDFARATESLKLCRGMIPPDLFRQVLSDPAFAPFRADSRLAEFYPPR